MGKRSRKPRFQKLQGSVWDLGRGAPISPEAAADAMDRAHALRRHAVRIEVRDVRGRVRGVVDILPTDDAPTMADKFRALQRADARYFARRILPVQSIEVILSDGSTAAGFAWGETPKLRRDGSRADGADGPG